MNGNIFTSNTLFGSTDTLVSMIALAASNAQLYAGAIQSNTASGTPIFNLAELTEVKPFSLYNQPERSIGVEGIADSSGVDQVLFELGSLVPGQASDRDYIRATRNGSTGEITLAVLVLGAAVFTQSLGAVAYGDPIKIAASWKDAVLNVSINGEVPFTKGSATQIESF